MEKLERGIGKVLLNALMGDEAEARKGADEVKSALKDEVRELLEYAAEARTDTEPAPKGPPRDMSQVLEGGTAEFPWNDSGDRGMDKLIRDAQEINPKCPRCGGTMAFRAVWCDAGTGENPEASYHCPTCDIRVGQKLGEEMPEDKSEATGEMRNAWCLNCWMAHARIPMDGDGRFRCPSCGSLRMVDAAEFKKESEQRERQNERELQGNGKSADPPQEGKGGLGEDHDEPDSGSRDDAGV